MSKDKPWNRIALINLNDGNRKIVTDNPDLDIFIIDEKEPDDRVYRMSFDASHENTVETIDKHMVTFLVPDEFDKLIGTNIGYGGDGSRAEKSALLKKSLGLPPDMRTRKQ